MTHAKHTTKPCCYAAKGIAGCAGQVKRRRECMGVVYCDRHFEPIRKKNEDRSRKALSDVQVAALI